MQQLPVDDEFVQDADIDDSVAHHEEGIRHPLGGHKHKFSHTSSDPFCRSFHALR